MNAPFLHFLIAGPCHRIYYIAKGSHQTPLDVARALRASGPLTARLGLGKITGRDDSPERWKKHLALIVRTTEVGLPVVGRNPSRVKCFEAAASLTPYGPRQVCEWKTEDLRFLFFPEMTVVREPCTTLILTHCFSKKRDDTPPVEIERYDRLRQAFYDWRDALKAKDAVAAFRLEQERLSL